MDLLLLWEFWGGRGFPDPPSEHPHPHMLPWAHLLWQPGTASPRAEGAALRSPFVLPFPAQASGLRLGSDLVRIEVGPAFLLALPSGTA